MNKKFIIGNLKMYGSIPFYQNLFQNIINLIQNDPLKEVEAALCLPYPYLYLAKELFESTNIAWGTQNIAKDNEGPFTGEVSAQMIKEFGSSYSIIGHSERNTAYCESNKNIAQKFMRIKDYQMCPILCVGETLIEREAGMEKNVVQSQLQELINCGHEIFDNSIIAYEPVWAIGSDMSASPEQAQSMCSFIKEFLTSEELLLANTKKNENKTLKVIYGGSVNEKNALQLLTLDDVDGALIGRCSLDAEKFIKICRSAHQI